jgi:hypothetical protein
MPQIFGVGRGVFFVFLFSPPTSSHKFKFGLKHESYASMLRTNAIPFKKVLAHHILPTINMDGVWRHCLLACLIDWLINWLIDWLIDWLMRSVKKTLFTDLRKHKFLQSCFTTGYGKQIYRWRREYSNLYHSACLFLVLHSSPVHDLVSCKYVSVNHIQPDFWPQKYWKVQTMYNSYNSRNV